MRTGLLVSATWDDRLTIPFDGKAITWGNSQMRGKVPYRHERECERGCALDQVNRPVR